MKRNIQNYFIHSKKVKIVNSLDDFDTDTEKADYYSSKEKSEIYYLLSTHRQIRKSSVQEIKVDTLDIKLYPMHLP